MRMLVIISPDIEYCPGQTTDAFVHIVKHMLEQRSGKTDVGVTVLRAMMVTGEANIQIELQSEVDDVVIEKIKQMFGRFPGFEYNVPQLTLSVTCRP